MKYQRALPGVALAALVAILIPAGVSAQGTTPPKSPPTPVPLATPLSSLPPASTPTSLPYPAYGTPAPVDLLGIPAAGVPDNIALEQAVAVGFAKSPLLASARADILSADAPVNLARSAILPNVSGNVSSTRNHRQPGGSSSSNSSSTGTTTGTTTGNGTGTGTTTTTTNTNTFSADSTSNIASVQLRQLIFDGGKISAQLRAARATQSAVLFTYRRQLQTVAFNVATAYYNYLAAKRATAVAVETVKLNQTQENLVVAQFRAGVAARADIATAQLPTAQARLSLVRAQGTELQQQAAFANAMGLDANSAVTPIDDTPVLTSTSAISTIAIPTYAQAVQRALALRPDFAAATSARDSTIASLRAAKLGLFPTLNGTASQAVASSDTSGGTFRNNGSIGISLSIPIFDQGITTAQTQQAQAAVDKNNALLDNARLNIQLNVKQSLVSLITARAGLDQANAELSKAQEVLRSTQAQYRAGVTTLPLLLNAQVGLTTALTDQVTAVYSLRQAEQAYLFAEGTNAAL